MDKRLKFNEDAFNYDLFRPAYCLELFQDIIAYSNLNSTSTALEVGIGTGQATKPFLELGCSVNAIELGKDLSEFVSQKFMNYPKFKVWNMPFEEYETEKNQFDLFYSATAFHWIPNDIGYPKAHELLKENGTLALFWNKPFVGKADDSLHQAIQVIYDSYFPNQKAPVEHDTERQNQLLQTIDSYGFKNSELRIYHQIRTFNAEAYISLLNTYSDHRCMELNRKEAFEKEIKEAILKHNNELKVYDTIELYLAKK